MTLSLYIESIWLVKAVLNTVTRPQLTLQRDLGRVATGPSANVNGIIAAMSHQYQDTDYNYEDDDYYDVDGHDDDEPGEDDWGRQPGNADYGIDPSDIIDDSDDDYGRPFGHRHYGICPGDIEDDWGRPYGHPSIPTTSRRMTA